MTSAMILTIAQMLLAYGPEAAKALKDLFSTAAPTDAQWQALWDKSQTRYEDYVSGAAK